MSSPFPLKFHQPSCYNQFLLSPCQATVKGVEMDLLTAHLESMANHSEERTRQLQKSYKEVTSAPPTSTVVFGGDLNLRDKEVGLFHLVLCIYVDWWEKSNTWNEFIHVEMCIR